MDAILADHLVLLGMGLERAEGAQEGRQCEELLFHVFRDGKDGEEALSPWLGRPWIVHAGRGY